MSSNNGGNKSTKFLYRPFWEALESETLGSKYINLFAYIINLSQLREIL